jgi:hypothetical protein
MIRVYIASGPDDAELFRGYLQENGIEAAVEGDELWVVQGVVPVGSAAAPSVWVNEPDAEPARALIREYEHPSKTDRPKWQCSNCGEKLAGQFSHCWHCGAPREAEA